MIKSKKILLIILAFALLSRLLPALIFHYPVINDAAAYDDIGKNLAQHFSYSRDGVTPTIERPPGYPVFLAVIYFVFGHNVQAVIFSQVLISVLSVYLLYLLSKFFLKEMSALICAGLVSVYPMFIYYNLFLYSENFAIFTCLLFLYYLFAGLKQNNRIYIFISGLSFIFFILTKPLFAPIILLVLTLFFLYKKNMDLKHQVLLFLLPVVLVWGVWILRNNLVFHKPIPFGIGLGPVLFVGNYPDFNGVWPQDYGEINKIAPPGNLSNMEYDDYLKAKAVSQMEKEPVQTARLFFIKLVKYFFVVQDLSQSKIYKQDATSSAIVFQLLFIVYKLYKILTSFFLVVGSVVIFNKIKENRNLFLLLILMSVWYGAVAHSLIYVDERYHLPMFSLQVILSVYALEFICAYLIKRNFSVINYLSK